MKKVIILAVCLTGFTVFNSSAKIWRVNSAGLPADFTTIQAAHDATAVLAGDTLHLEPSGVSYGALVSTKKLIIVGPGYFLDQNPNQQTNPAAAIIESFTLNAGSEGTVISGLTILTTQASHINTGNITVSRNKFAGSIYLAGGHGYSNIIISGNYGITGIISDGTSVELITNVFILNNYLGKVIFSTQFSGVIANNIFYQHSGTVYYFTIKNNIGNNTDGSPVFYGNTNTVNNNLSASGVGFPAGNGNQNNVVMSTVYVGASGNSDDGQYKLKTGSPAIGAGLNGEDCGMFGGNEPYRLSGLPEIPSVYLLTAPSNSNGPTLPVTISVKTNN